MTCINLKEILPYITESPDHQVPQQEPRRAKVPDVWLLWGKCTTKWLPSLEVLPSKQVASQPSCFPASKWLPSQSASGGFPAKVLPSRWLPSQNEVRSKWQPLQTQPYNKHKMTSCNTSETNHAIHHWRPWPWARVRQGTWCTTRPHPESSQTRQLPSLTLTTALNKMASQARCLPAGGFLARMKQSSIEMQIEVVTCRWNTILKANMQHNLKEINLHAMHQWGPGPDC